MADNLARAGDDSLGEDPSLDSILNRLNSLGGSSDENNEAAPPLRGVPDLEPGEMDSDSTDEIPEPASLHVVKNPDVVDIAANEVDVSDSEVDISDSGDSPFRSRGLFDVSSPEEPEAPTVAAATVASPADLSDLLSGSKAADTDADDADSKTQADSETQTDSATQESASVEVEPEAVESEAVEVEQPERIDYFADLHSGEAPAIAGVPASSLNDGDDELELDPGFTVEEAFTSHPAQPDPEDIVLTDTHGLLADPLDIKETAPPTDGTGYEQHFSHGVQFPGMEKATDPSDPLYVENPYEGLEPKSKGMKLKSIISLILLIAAIAVLYFILSDGMAVDDIREGVEIISE